MIKKYLKWAIGAFCIFYLLSNPTGAASAVNGAASGLGSAAHQLSVFVGGLGK